jgi:hypothetical protein
LNFELDSLPVTGLNTFKGSFRFFIQLQDFKDRSYHSLSRYDGLVTKQKSLCHVLAGVFVNLCTVTVIELIVFSYNGVIVQ